MPEVERSEAANVTASAFGVGRLRPGSVQVTVGNKVTPINLQDILKEILGQHGCTTCGLGGLDILIRQQDPRIIEGFKHIAEVKDVTIIR